MARDTDLGLDVLQKDKGGDGACPRYKIQFHPNAVAIAFKLSD
jgi:hypothetical protein